MIPWVQKVRLLGHLAMWSCGYGYGATGPGLSGPLPRSLIHPFWAVWSLHSTVCWQHLWLPALHPPCHPLCDLHLICAHTSYILVVYVYICTIFNINTFIQAAMLWYPSLHQYVLHPGSWDYTWGRQWPVYHTTHNICLHCQLSQGKDWLVSGSLVIICPTLPTRWHSALGHSGLKPALSQMLGNCYVLFCGHHLMVIYWTRHLC